MSSGTVHVLLVDDDTVAVKGFKRGMAKLKVANPVHRARDGEEALQMLRGSDGHEAVPVPRVVVLDLNMPRMNGLEFLAELRGDPDLHRTVVFVLTTSDDERDRLAAYDHHVAGYIVKSEGASAFVDAITMLSTYWRVVELPEE